MGKRTGKPSGRPREGSVEYCTRCGKEMYRSPSHRKRGGRPFCSRQCHMKTLNEELNPTRMTPEVRRKLRECHLETGEGKCYAKLYSRLAHRVVAEQMLGRPLREGEVVHHIDGDIRNYSPDNLQVFASGSEHTKHHAALRREAKANAVHSQKPSENSR